MGATKKATAKVGNQIMTDNELDSLRNSIDKIDDRLIKLLTERNNVVKQVGNLKARRGDGHSIIRPGREADMIRRIVEKGGAGFSSAALALMWRLIISSAINIEEDPKISTYSLPNNREAYWLAREYFGAFTPMEEHPTTAEVLSDILRRKATVGVVPLKDEGNSQPWWSRISSEKKPPHVFAKLPFVQMASSDKPVLVALGYVIPEPTAEDESLWVLKAPETVIFSWLEPLLKKAGIAFKTEANCRVLQVTTYQHYLIKMEGFVDQNDKRIKDFFEEANKEFGTETASIEMDFLGSYATPICFDMGAV